MSSTQPSSCKGNLELGSKLWIVPQIPHESWIDPKICLRKSPQRLSRLANTSRGLSWHKDLLAASKWKFELAWKLIGPKLNLICSPLWIESLNWPANWLAQNLRFELARRLALNWSWSARDSKLKVWISMQIDMSKNWNLIWPGNWSETVLRIRRSIWLVLNWHWLVRDFELKNWISQKTEWPRNLKFEMARKMARSYLVNWRFKLARNCPSRKPISPYGVSV